MLSFYVRVFLTYVPLLGLRGFLGLLFLVRSVGLLWVLGRSQSGVPSGLGAVL